MRKIFLLLVLLTTITDLFSQQFNFHRKSLGISGGLTRAFVDLPNQINSPGIAINLDHYFSPFMIATLELQGGMIAGGDSSAISDLPHLPPGERSHRRFFQNSYQALSISGKVQLGQFVNYENSFILGALKGIYGGIGIGVIHNNMSQIVRVKPDGSKWVFPGKDKSFNFLIPLNVGISFGFKDSWKETRYIVGLNYQSNLTFGEGLDGYNDPPKAGFQNNAVDQYNMATIGIKYCFGTLHGFYRR